MRRLGSDVRPIDGGALELLNTIHRAMYTGVKLLCTNTDCVRMVSGYTRNRGSSLAHGSTRRERVSSHEVMVFQTKESCKLHGPPFQEDFGEH